MKVEDFLEILAKSKGVDPSNYGEAVNKLKTNGIFTFGDLQPLSKSDLKDDIGINVGITNAILAALEDPSSLTAFKKYDTLEEYIDAHKLNEQR